MDKDLLALLIWLGSTAIAIPLIYFKQDRYLTSEQPLAILVAGPIALALAIFCSAQWFTSRDKAEGK
jgi:hypothetical protein